MSLTCRLETETGEPVEVFVDRADVFREVLPRIEDERFHCLRFIDWYGDTVFNRLQMDRFIAELRLIGPSLKTPEQRDWLERIERLAQRCRDEVHLYLKFYGD